MKAFGILAALAVSGLALPALAQEATAAPASTGPWWNPTTYAHNGYVEVDGGTSFQGRSKVYGATEGVGAYSASDDLRPDLFASALVGHNLTPAIGLELEGIYSRNAENSVPLSTFAGAPTSGSLLTYGALANVKLRVPYTYRYRSMGVTPYIAAGAGYGTSQYRLSDGVNARENGLLWQGKVGLEIKTGLPVSFDIGYRYLSTPNYETPGAYAGTYSSAQVKSYIQAATIGVKYSF